MSTRLRAIYQGGAFVPMTPCNLPENAEVELTIEGGFLLGPIGRTAKERTQALERMVERMLENPIPADSPHFTREELHERR